MLDEIQVKLDDLFLDPNNPRFKVDLKKSKIVTDDQIEKLQSAVLKNFGKNPSPDDEDVTNIADLYESMRTIGYVPIDRVVVRKFNENNKYLVIEGNRRISTIKTLINDYKNRNGVLDKTQERRKYEKVSESFDEITCMLLKTEKLSAEEISQKISIILGLRHHGSLLEWEPLPKAYNIYKEYMNIEPKLENFVFKTLRKNEVSNRLSISGRKVVESLKTYVVYIQLCDLFEVKDRHYSLIQAIVTNKHLEKSFYNINPNTYELDDTSLEKINKLCQFSTRNSIPQGKKKIIEKPQKIATLGKLYFKRQKANNDSLKSYANDIINRVLDEDDEDMSIDDGLDDLTNYENRVFWVQTVENLLNKQEKTLRIEDFTGIGNDLGNKDALKDTLKPLEKIMGI
jgi:hypothetical protein